MAECLQAGAGRLLMCKLDQEYSYFDHARALVYDCAPRRFHGIDRLDSDRRTYLFRMATKSDIQTAERNLRGSVGSNRHAENPVVDDPIQTVLANLCNAGSRRANPL